MTRSLKLDGPKPKPPAAPARKPAPPQPANRPLPPGVTGTLPLPTNKVVGMISPASLTDMELDALKGVGWTEDMPIPDNMAGLFDKIRGEHADRVDPLPVAPGTPRAVMNTVPIEEAKPEDRERIRAVLTQAAADRQAEIEQARQDQDLQRRASTIPGLDQATKVAAKVAAKASDEPVIENDSKPAAPPEPAAKSDTGADARPPACLHCGHPYGAPDVVEPSHADKMAFLHCMLGQTYFKKEYELFAGAVVVTFRSLTANEIKAVYKQAYKDRQDGKLPEEADYWEQVNRYRLYLQLLDFRAIGPDGFVHTLPDGLSEDTHPGAEGYWELPDGKVLMPDETPLPFIEQFLTAKVVKTEAIFRVVNVACNEFNRLMAKMEAMADNSDFWKPTGAPS